MRAGLVAAVLVFALVACGGNQPGAGGGDASEIPSLPEDPCALVTVEEVEAATGETVVRVGLIPDERLIRARVEKFDLPEIFAANPCEYVTDGTHASIVVHVDPHGGPDFEDQRERDPVNTEAIEGVGDRAYAHGLASLHVRVDDGYFIVATQHGAGWPGIHDLEELARAALA
jgi:hypothetical protein